MAFHQNPTGGDQEDNLQRQNVDDCDLTALLAFDCAQHRPTWRTYATALRAIRADDNVTLVKWQIVNA